MRVSELRVTLETRVRNLWLARVCVRALELVSPLVPASAIKQALRWIANLVRVEYRVDGRKWHRMRWSHELL